MAKSKKSKPKETPEYKTISDVFASYFLKPNARRSSFLYTGFNVPEDCFVLGSDPKHMYFGSPDQTLYVIRITNPDMLAIVKKFFLDFGIDVSKLGILELAPLIATYIKQKGESLIIGQDDEGGYVMSAPCLEEPRSISKTYDSLFILHQFAKTAQEFLPYIGEGRNDVFTLPFKEEISDKLYRVDIPHDQFAQTAPGKVFPSIIRVLLAKGLDLLGFKHIKPNIPTFTGLKFWPFSGSSLKYAFCIDTPDCSIIATRCNVFLIPE